MPTNLFPADEPYKLHATFHDNHVVHHRPGARWWGGTKEKWTRMKQLGVGGFGVVWLEKETTTQQLRAVKKLAVEQLVAQKVDFKRELQTLIALKDHQDLFVQFLGWYEDKDFVYLAMEYVEHGDLEQYLKEFGTAARRYASEITRQLLEGLVVLHERNICHRDLKPQNVLVASTSPIRVRLADFGVSKCTDGTKLRTQCGTQGYQAPEILGLLPRHISRGTGYTIAVDMWALGSLVYEILTLETPFLEAAFDTECSGVTAAPTGHTLMTDMSLLHRFCSGEIGLPTEALRQRVEDRGLDFVKRLLVADPEGRMSAVQALNHRWMFDLPAVLDNGNACQVLRSQFLTLGTNLSIKAIKKLLSECRQRRDMNFSAYLPHPKKSAGDLLYKAASKGYILIVEMLLNTDGITNSVESRSELDRNVLKAAVRGGHLDVVRLLLLNNHNIDFQRCRFHDPTALQVAAGCGHLKIVKLLLGRNAEVNAEACKVKGRTALQAAAEGGCIEIAKMLLEHDADVNAQPAEDTGRTALQAAAGSGHLELVTLLLERGANVNAKPCKHHGQTALQAAAAGGHLEVVRALLEKDADVNARAVSQWNSGRTALQAAAARGHLEVVRLLLKNDANVNAEPYSFNGRTALQAAAEGGHLAVTKLLLESNGDVNAKPCKTQGQTALQAAAEGGHLELVRLLLDAGADVNTAPCSGGGRTALEAAIIGEHSEVESLLRSTGGVLKRVRHIFGIMRFEQISNWQSMTGAVTKRPTWG